MEGGEGSWCHGRGQEGAREDSEEQRQHWCVCGLVWVWIMCGCVGVGMCVLVCGWGYECVGGGMSVWVGV